MFLFAANTLYPVASGGGGGGTPVTLVRISDGDIAQNGVRGQRMGGVRLGSNGTVYYRYGTNYYAQENWLLSGVASSYAAYVTGTTNNGDAFSTELNLGTTREWYGSPSGNYTLHIEIRKASDHSVLDTADFTIAVTNAGAI